MEELAELLELKEVFIFIQKLVVLERYPYQYITAQGESRSIMEVAYDVVSLRKPSDKTVYGT